MDNNIIEIHNLSKEIKGNYILENINLSIQKGEIYGLLGSNGAGKSTLMKILVGMIVNYEGKILFDNHELYENDYQMIGSLIEYPALYNDLSIYENFKIFCLENHISISNIDEISKIMNIDYLNKRFKHCSLGMKEKAGIALALLKKPKLLILDEPFNGLDPYGIKELKSTLKKINDNGTSILISDHIFSNLENVITSIGILSNQTLVYQDKVGDTETIEELFFNYTNH